MRHLPKETKSENFKLSINFIKMKGLYINKYRSSENLPIIKSRKNYWEIFKLKMTNAKFTEIETLYLKSNSKIRGLT